VLDTTQRFSVPEVPGAWIFPDDGDPRGFYAVPSAPRIALDENGRDELSLVVYGRTHHGSFVPTGALLTLTTSLELSAEETQALLAILSRRTAAEPSEGAQPPVHLLAFDAESGEAEAALTEGLVLRGAPSLTGGFRCSFSEKLDAEQARSLQTAWDGGLADARLSYRLRLRSPGSSSSLEVEHTTWSRRSGEVTDAGSATAVAVAASAGSAHELTLAGPLAASGLLADARAQVEL
jgi:hypothetical protein